MRLREKLSVVLSALFLTTGGASTVSASGFAFTTSEEYVNTQVLGTVEYQGGFLQDARVNFPQPIAITNFSVEVPAFCSGVEVLEAGYTASRGPVRAAPVAGEKNKFAIPAGTAVASLWVTLNGPASQSCTIPLMSVDDGSTPADPVAHELDGRYAGTRNVQIELLAGQVVRHNIMLQMAGVPNPSPVRFTTGFAADFYMHGQWESRAFADQVILSPVSNQWVACRVPLSFRMLYTPGNPDLFALSMTSPSYLSVDMFGRCTVAGSRTDTATIQRLP
jgi:hypothetical protein